ncbi:MAG: T9SS type A sorting domain-containing protein [bacterium]
MKPISTILLTVNLLLLTAHLLPSNLALAENWPDEPGVARHLIADSTRDYQVVSVVEAEDGSLRLLVCYPNPGLDHMTFELHALNRDGSFLWTPADSGRTIGSWRFESLGTLPVQMKCWPGGETSIVCQEEMTYGISTPEWSHYWIEAQVRMQMVSSEGASRFETPSYLSEKNTALYNQLLGVVWFDDGGSIVLWIETRNNDFEPYPPKPLFAQRLDASGIPVWPEAVQILDSLTAPIGSCIRDGEGGVLLTMGNQLWRLRSTGEFFQVASGTVFDSLRTGGKVPGFELEPGRMLLVGFNSDLSGAWWIIVDALGNFENTEFAPFGDPLTSWILDGPFPWGENGYAARFYRHDPGYMLSVVDPGLQESRTIVLGPIAARSAPYNWYQSRNGLRVFVHDELSDDYDDPDRNVVFGFDPDGELAWQFDLTEPGVEKVSGFPFLASDGTTFIFWNMPTSTTRRRDVYGNAVDLDGNWGAIQPTSLIELGEISLPSRIFLNTWPNPFNGTVNIHVSLPVKAPAALTILNMIGQQVAAFSIPASANPTAVVSWTPGESLASGVYFVRAEQRGKSTVLKKIVLMR